MDIERGHESSVLAGITYCHLGMSASLKNTDSEFDGQTVIVPYMINCRQAISNSKTLKDSELVHEMAQIVVHSFLSMQ